MKKLLVLLILSAVSAFAQSGHGVTLTVSPAPDAIASSTYNIYYAKAACSTNPTLTLLTALPVGVLTYFDSEGVGTYCYDATQVQNGSESVPTSNVVANVKPNPPNGLTGAGK